METGSTAKAGRRSARRHAALWLALGSVGLTCLVVNPLRDTAVDDDWAYSETVQHLLQTGHYRLNDWAAPNLRFQVYWGSLFARVFGFSNEVLRVATLVLVFFGLLALYGLAREHGLKRHHAGLIVLAFWASPLVVLHSFTFLTEAPFLALLIISLWLSARAFRRRSTLEMLLAGVAASCAIFTRQFGIALIGALALLWMFDAQRIAKTWFYLCGIALPAASGSVQIFLGSMSPNWAARWRMRDEALWLAQPGPFATGLLWRPTIILQYLALFVLPLVLLALPGFLLRASRGAGGRLLLDRGALVRNGLLLGCVAGSIALGLKHGRDVNPHHALMPLLPNSLAVLMRSGLWGRGLITVFTSVGATLLGGVVVRRYSADGGWRRLRPGNKVLDLATLFLLCLHLAYVDLCDEYLLVFLPFTLIVLGRHLRHRLDRLLIPATIGCLALLAASTVWTRGILEEEDAIWQGGELALRQVPGNPRLVSASFAWECAHGAFQDYLTKIHHRIPRRGLAGFFHRYRPERRAAAAYLVYPDVPGKPPDAGAERLAEIPYRDELLHRRSVYVEKTAARTALGSPASDARAAPLRSVN